VAAQDGAARQLAHVREGDLQQIAAGLARAYCEHLPFGPHPARAITPARLSVSGRRKDHQL
jgi:hypothetical protein